MIILGKFWSPGKLSRVLARPMLPDDNLPRGGKYLSTPVRIALSKKLREDHAAAPTSDFLGNCPARVFLNIEPLPSSEGGG